MNFTGSFLRSCGGLGLYCCGGLSEIRRLPIGTVSRLLINRFNTVASFKKEIRIGGPEDPPYLISDRRNQHLRFRLRLLREH